MKSNIPADVFGPLVVAVAMYNDAVCSLRGYVELLPDGGRAEELTLDGIDLCLEDLSVIRTQVRTVEKHLLRVKEALTLVNERLVRDHQPSRDPDSCPNCGGTMCGDGFTTVRHCEFAEDDIDDKEPDAPAVLCKAPKEDEYAT